jgi:hypothetical protein
VELVGECGGTSGVKKKLFPRKILRYFSTYSLTAKIIYERDHINIYALAQGRIG